ncbi:sodium hydrogen exchanger [Diplodia corticola]|uniref:Sodium hydrogen exchanger n=1 Tax=Diplodia corticola TaxID=236234 RepID=A0A1J9SA89_9PEZI|nr:sodium hydrogen exchanger [Diplodia corticola]OJD37399.1 sodium hydrogen exchanger [Diplodia corticola]
MAWSQLEPTAPHLTYIVLSSFLIAYALFSLFIRNRLHLSEPPLATVFGIIFGPHGARVLHPQQWGMDDLHMQELTRLILGIQVFSTGIELPPGYFSLGPRGNWQSVLVLIGPVMVFGWLVCAALIWALLGVDFAVALVISACMTPTDPVLAASVLANSQFSTRVPKRLRRLLSAESGCNDGASFPFLYVGLFALTSATSGEAVKQWFLITLLWQCAFGVVLGVTLGFAANRVLRFVHARDFIGRASYLVFYLLAAVFCTGVAATLGTDDFLLAFSAGVGFNHDGWFRREIAQTRLPHIIDLILNSTMFVLFGASIPWSQFSSSWSALPSGTSSAVSLGPGRLLALLACILLLRRIPAVLAAKPLIPDLQTYREALFAGHFGPIGVGALFLALEARAQLETGTSQPLPYPPADGDAAGLSPQRRLATLVVWPVVCFIVLGSTMVHGCSTLAISVGSHFSRKEGERAPLIGAETDGFGAMVYDEDEVEEEEWEEENEENEVENGVED